MSGRRGHAHQRAEAPGGGPGARPSRRAPRRGTLNVKRWVTQPRGRAGGWGWGGERRCGKAGPRGGCSRRRVRASRAGSGPSGWERQVSGGSGRGRAARPAVGAARSLPVCVCVRRGPAPGERPRRGRCGQRGAGGRLRAGGAGDERAGGRLLWQS